MFERFYLKLFFFQILIENIKSEWPLSVSSNIQLLGLFPDKINSSKPSLASVHSRAMFKSAIKLSQIYNIKIQGEFINSYSIETGGDVINGLAQTCRLISNSTIVGIVGPALSRESQFIGPFAGKIGIPVISYGSTSSQLSDKSLYPSFYRTVPSDKLAALAIVDLFLQFNWTSTIIIYQNDAFGINGANVINEEFKKQNLNFFDMIEFNIVTHKIEGDFQTLLSRSPTRIILVWAEPYHTSLIVENALNYDLIGPQFVWILSTKISLNNFNISFYEKLNGLFIIEPVVGNIINASINETLLNAAYEIWQNYEPSTYPGADYVDYYALFAFDATWTLIQSLKEFSLKNLSSIQLLNRSFCFDQYFDNSQILYNIIDNIKYLGVSGQIQFNNETTDRIDGIYYITKNIQLIKNLLNYVPVLKWSQLNHWTSYSSTSVIVWPGNSLKIPSGYASLSHVTLRIAVTETAPFTMITQDEDKIGRKLIGYMPDLIDLLVKEMKFIPNITLISNKTFNEIINLVAINEYDLFIAQTTMTAARRQNVAFSNSIFDNSLRILIRKETNDDMDFFSFLRPFSLRLWFAVLGACLFAALLIYILERHENCALKHRSSISLIGMSMWYSIGVIVGYGVDFHVTTAAGRLLTLALYILSLVLVAAYTANLASELTISKSKDIIDGIDDIKNGKLSYSRIGILVGSSLEDYYLREISFGSRNYYPLKTKQEVYDALLNNIIDASIMDGSVVEYITGNIFCNLTLVGTDFSSNAFGIVFQKNWQYEQILDINILSLREQGLLDDLKAKWFKTTICSQEAIVTSTAMTIQSMIGLFLTFGIISLLALIVFLWKNKFHIKIFLYKFLQRINLLIKKDVIIINHTINNNYQDSSISKSTTFIKSSLETETN